jgi:hypothetical protein
MSRSDRDANRRLNVLHATYEMFEHDLAIRGDMVSRIADHLPQE